jgi:hypothetical protein
MLSFIFSALISTSHAAKIYHWVDENGRPHYSENPPREIQSEALNVQATGTGSAGSPAASTTSKPATKSSETKSEEAEGLTAEHSPEEKAKYCQQSQKLLQQMNANTQRRFEQADGSFRRLEQAEIADYKAQAQSGIERYCN